MKNYRIEIKWVLLYTVTYLLWMVMEKVLGFHSTRIAQQSITGTLLLIPSFAIYLLLLFDKRKNQYHGIMSFRQGFGSGLVFTVGIVLLSPITQWITHTIISPDFFSNMIAYAVNSAAMTRDQAEQQLNLPSFIMISVVAGLITGAVFSAIASFFAKSKTTVTV